ncbi:MAG: hypothetical protein IIZ66_06390 [Clostridia bacterium]|nr:hypothetical protein [Clostridia bacterium]MCR5689126.1 hypothetical protein [Clostridiales bacterium]
MVSLLIGPKGSGKTKKLIDEIDDALARSKGNVVCVEKNDAMRINVNFRARLVKTDDYGISGYNELYAFLSGLCAGNYDITDILIDATLRIGGRDMDELCAFLERVAALAAKNETNFVFTVSAQEDQLPAKIFDFCKKIAI